jgi:hypothetical protein
MSWVEEGKNFHPSLWYFTKFWIQFEYLNPWCQWHCCDIHSSVTDTAVACRAVSLTPLLHIKRFHWCHCDMHSGVIDIAVTKISNWVVNLLGEYKAIFKKALKGQLHEIFDPQFFFINQPTPSRALIHGLKLFHIWPCICRENRPYSNFSVVNDSLKLFQWGHWPRWNCFSGVLDPAEIGLKTITMICFNS